MKTLVRLTLSACVLLLTACHDTANETPLPEQGSGTISFSVLNYEQLSYDDTRSDAPQLSNLDCLDMAVYSVGTNTLITNERKENGDEGYGSFSATLPYGTYNIVFLGYSDKRRAELDSPTNIVFTDNFVPNCFCRTLPLTVDAENLGTRNISLQRVMADFTLVSKPGNIPENLATIRITATGGGHHLNALTGYAPQAEERVFSFNVAGVDRKKDLILTYHTFLPEQETAMNFTVAALDTEGKEIRTRTFSNVPMKINQRTRYTGDFFVPDVFNITLEDKEWNIEEHNY